MIFNDGYLTSHVIFYFNKEESMVDETFCILVIIVKIFCNRGFQITLSVN